jgi:hypothetical protein
VILLGEAYAFGVAWSFFMKSLAVVVLRFTEPEVERWKVPLNIRVRGVDIPICLAMILREGDVYAIALRHLEEDLRSGDAEVMDSIQREAALRETIPKDR